MSAIREGGVGQTPSVRVLTLDHRVPATSEAIVGVQQAAYALEAHLLGATRFPPLEVTASDIRASGGVFLGAQASEELVGVISHEPGAVPGVRDITSLVVLPRWHRAGVATRLLSAALRECTEPVVTVSTGAGNGPALGLYAAFGFVEQARCVKGPEALEIVVLRLDRSGPSAEGSPPAR